MSTNLIIQYTLVGICLLAACVWIVVKVSKRNKNQSGCFGCSLSETCGKRPLKENAYRIKSNNPANNTDPTLRNVDSDCPDCSVSGNEKD